MAQADVMPTSGPAETPSAAQPDDGSPNQQDSEVIAQKIGQNLGQIQENMLRILKAFELMGLPEDTLKQLEQTATAFLQGASDALGEGSPESQGEQQGPVPMESGGHGMPVA